MSKNQLVPVKPNLPAVFKKEPNIMLTPVMTYTPVDPLHYSFTYAIHHSSHYGYHISRINIFIYCFLNISKINYV